jgi:hypothetical protein
LASALAWFGADEQPSPNVLAGGTLVLGALVVNELDWLETTRHERRSAARSARTAVRSTEVSQ